MENRVFEKWSKSYEPDELVKARVAHAIEIIKDFTVGYDAENTHEGVTCWEMYADDKGTLRVYKTELDELTMWSICRTIFVDSTSKARWNSIDVGVFNNGTCFYRTQVL